MNEGYDRLIMISFFFSRFKYSLFSKSGSNFLYKMACHSLEFSPEVGGVRRDI